MKCSKCGKAIGSGLGTEGNYVECKRVMVSGEQILLGYVEREWKICFDCWQKLYYGMSLYRFGKPSQEEIDKWYNEAP